MILMLKISWLGTVSNKTKLRLLIGAAGIFTSFALVNPTQAQTVTPPKTIVPGKITFCSDISTPPLEYYNAASEPVGSDIELGNALAAQMNLTASWKNVPFSGIIPFLLAGHCDAIISELFDKPARREVIDMVDYMNASESVMVKSGSSNKIKSLDDLSGLKVAVEDGTTIDTLLMAQSQKLVAAGKKPIEIVLFPSDTDALQQLTTGQVDAYGTTLETAVYYIQKSPHAFSIAGKPFAQVPVGVGVSKTTPDITKALTQALVQIRNNGTYAAIYKKYGLQADMLGVSQ
jgi:polar amino acid transport system substrate-binding protein